MGRKSAPSGRAGDPVERARPRTRATVLLLALVLSSAVAGITSAASAGAQTPKVTAWELEAVDVASEAGVAEVSGTWDASPVDFDADGLTDWLFVRHHQLQASRLYRNIGGGFVEVDVGNFPERDRHDCTWADVDADGLIDGFCSVGAGHGTTRKTNELWMQTADRRFVNRVSDYGLDDDIYGRGRSSTFIDVNHDPYPDLFVGNLYPRSDGNPSPNRFYINEGGTSYRAAPEYGLDLEVGASCVQAADYNNDGWEDLLVCGKPRMKLYRNEAGLSFSDQSSAEVVHGFWEDGLMTDINVDGRLDLVRVRNLSAQVRLQALDGKFRPAYDWTLEDGEAVAAGDIDGDGLEDVYVVQGCGAGTVNLPDRLFLNQAATGFAEDPDIPQASAGCGQTTAAIDYDANDRDDFIVLNGHIWVQGPVQLITYAEQPVVLLQPHE